MNILMVLDNPFTHDYRVYKEAKSLINHGYDVTVLAWDKYQRYPKNDVKEGIDIVRFSNSFVNLVKNYKKEILYAIDPFNIFRRSFGMWLPGYWEALKLHKKKTFDIIHCHDFYSLPIGVKLKERLGTPFVYDAHELWNPIISGTNPKPLTNYYMRKEKQGLENADHIITVAEPHLQHFLNRGYQNVTIVSNCKEKISDKYIPSRNKVFNLIYIGVFNGKRFTPEAIEICKEISDIRFELAGYGGNEDKIKNLINNDSKNRTRFLGKLPMNEVIPKTLEADAILCMLDPSFMNNRVGPPNKLFEAMVCGRPVIATKNTYSGKLVKKLDMGLAIDYDKKSFKNAVIKLRDNPDLRKRLGKNALKAALLRYNWEEEEKRLLEVYEKVL